VTNEYENTAPIATKQPHEKELPTMLTEQERKRLKHITKLEKRNEEHLMIKLGLKEKEVPKLKPGQLISFSRGQTPTQIEMAMRKARDDRIKAHEDANAAAKLTPEQKREKKAGKRMADAKGDVVVTVFAVRKLDGPLVLAKLTSMANKWFITGGLFFVKYPKMSFVVVEAGEKGTRKYGALVNQRIEWGDGNEVAMVFQGPAMRRCFFNFHKYIFDVGTQCRAFCQKFEATALFDAAARQFGVREE
jgi:U4/U6 small nuclear ribonucleoprotein PRP3